MLISDKVWISSNSRSQLGKGIMRVGSELRKSTLYIILRQYRWFAQCQLYSTRLLFVLNHAVKFWMFLREQKGNFYHDKSITHNFMKWYAISVQSLQVRLLVRHENKDSTVVVGVQSSLDFCHTQHHFCQCVISKISVQPHLFESKQVKIPDTVQDGDVSVIA